MNDAPFTLLLAAAWFGAVNLVLSAACAGLGRLVERGTFGPRFATSPARLFALKLAPGVSALLFTLAVFLPAQWRFEPQGVEENAGYTLVAFGALGGLTLLSGARRVIRDTRLTLALRRSWESRATGPLAVPGSQVPVFLLPDGPAVISLDGIRRPRVFVTQSVLDVLSREELDASLAHEHAHQWGRDNLKRVLMACSPDLLGLFAGGRAIERRWRAAVEFAADARAVRGSENRAVSLASALVKVARLSPAASPAARASALFDGRLLSVRIDKLLAPDAPPADLEEVPAIGPAWSLSLVAMTLVGAVLASQGVWLSVHLATEGLVRMLP